MQLRAQGLQEQAVLLTLLLQERHCVLQPAERSRMGLGPAIPPTPASPKATMPQTLPVVVLLQRAPLIPELPDTVLVLSKFLCQPPLLPTPLAQLCFSLPCSGAGSQERLLHPRQLWGQRAWWCHCHPT